MSESTGQPINPKDVTLGELVVEHGLATREEVEQALAELKRPAPGGKPRNLADVLIAQGSVTQRQLARLMPSHDTAQSPAQQIPGYQILARLGSGAMATVFKARQLSLDRLVAIKVLPRRYSDDPEYVQRFYQEGQAAAKLNHPNIVQAFDVGEAEGYHYFVMEYVEGHTLHDDLAAGKVFSEAEALRIIIQIARALAHAHARGLIHRDVKPKNIMITPEGSAKLADMGLARLAADEQAAQAEAGRAFGTPYYISPEQIRGELDIDFRADIYSLGATLYHLVTGQVPFEAPTPAAVMHRHLRDPLVPPDHINTQLSKGLGEVVEVMMAKPRDLRYASTKDLLADLESVAGGEPPLQVRRVLNASDLAGLADDEGPAARHPAGTDEPSAGPDRLVIALWLLAAALFISILINIIQAAI